MAATTRLEMVFRTSGGRRATISVLDPLDTLDAETVETAMNTIISKNIFDSNSGELVAAAQARITTRETVSLFENE
jgi:hypothetical protein